MWVSDLSMYSIYWFTVTMELFVGLNKTVLLMLNLCFVSMRYWSLVELLASENWHLQRIWWRKMEIFFGNEWDEIKHFFCVAEITKKNFVTFASVSCQPKKSISIAELSKTMLWYFSCFHNVQYIPIPRQFPRLSFPTHFYTSFILVIYSRKIFTVASRCLFDV